MGEMKEPKFEDGLKFEGMPKLEVMPVFEGQPKFEDGPGFTGEPRFAGLDLAKKTMEVCVLHDGRNRKEFFWGEQMQTKFHELSERVGKTKSAVAVAQRLVCLLWILVTRREFYADMSREGLMKRLCCYKITYEG
jgi:hypothetical protein